MFTTSRGRVCSVALSRVQRRVIACTASRCRVYSVVLSHVQSRIVACLNVLTLRVRVSHRSCRARAHRFCAAGENWAWPGEDDDFTRKKHRRRVGRCPELSHVDFQLDRTTSIFGAAGENWAWPGEDVIFTQNQHRHRVGRGPKLSHGDFQANRRTSIFGAAGENWAWQGGDVIFTKNHCHHRIKIKSCHNMS